MLLLSVLPWTGFEITRRSNGLFRADELKNDAHPNVAYALLGPGLVLPLRAVLDYDVLQFTYAVALYVLVGCVFFAAILMFDPTHRSRKSILPVFFLSESRTDTGSLWKQTCNLIARKAHPMQP